MWLQKAASEKQSINFVGIRTFFGTTAMEQQTEISLLAG
jgi:hypothetical protein